MSEKWGQETQTSFSQRRGSQGGTESKKHLERNVQIIPLFGNRSLKQEAFEFLLEACSYLLSCEIEGECRSADGGRLLSNAAGSLKQARRYCRSSCGWWHSQAAQRHEKVDIKTTKCNAWHSQPPSIIWQIYGEVPNIWNNLWTPAPALLLTPSAALDVPCPYRSTLLKKWQRKKFGSPAQYSIPNFTNRFHFLHSHGNSKAHSLLTLF